MPSMTVVLDKSPLPVTYKGKKLSPEVIMNKAHKRQFHGISYTSIKTDKAPRTARPGEKQYGYGAPAKTDYTF